MEKTIEQINENSACWYVVYTAARTEKKVEKLLDQAGYESYLPSQKVIRAWGNHQRSVMVSVVPGFIFVCLSEVDIAKVATLSGVSFLLKEEGCPVSLSNEQLMAFRSKIEEGVFLDFTFGVPVEQNDRNVLIHIEGLGAVMLRQ